MNVGWGVLQSFQKTLKVARVDFEFQRMHWDVKPTVAVVIV